MRNNFEIIATVNTNNIDSSLLRYVDSGATILRINGAFLDSNSLVFAIKRMRKIIGDSARILVDLPGYKLRFLYLEKDIRLKKNFHFKLKKNDFNYPDFFDVIERGSLIRFNNGFNSFTVVKKNKDSIICTAHNDGIVARGKGFHIHNVSYRPVSNSLSDFDIQIIESIKDETVDYVGLSFVHNNDDVEYVERKLNSAHTRCIPKIESKESVSNLLSIVKDREMVILDRGDLAGEIGLDSIWKAQRKVISACRLFDCKIILATQMLASMVENPIPTIAEVDSLYQALHLGIDGIQLSEEVSVGKFAKASIEFVRNTVNDFKHAAAQAKKKGSTIWLLGLTSCGKSSIAEKIVEKLRDKGITMVHYDGDEVRNMFSAGFGFSRKDRLCVVKNLVYLANKSARDGFNVIVSALTAHEDARRYVRQNAENLETVFLKCSVNECARRDPKGLYKRAKNGELSTLIGFNTPFKAPGYADLVVDTEKNSIDTSADKIIHFMIKKGISL